MSTSVGLLIIIYAWRLATSSGTLWLADWNEIKWNGMKWNETKTAKQQRIELLVGRLAASARLTSTSVARWSWAATWRLEQLAVSNGAAIEVFCHPPPSRRPKTNWNWRTCSRATLDVTCAKWLDAKEHHPNTFFSMSKVSRRSTGHVGPAPWKP